MTSIAIHGFIVSNVKGNGDMRILNDGCGMSWLNFVGSNKKFEIDMTLNKLWPLDTKEVFVPEQTDHKMQNMPLSHYYTVNKVNALFFHGFIRIIMPIVLI